MPTAALHTLGCKLNFAETATIGRQLQAKGYTLVAFGAPADLCVINSCSVTARAGRECRQVIRRARRTAPHALVVVTGCYAQLEPEEAASIEGVDLVLGMREKPSLAEHVAAADRGRGPRVLVSAVARTDDFGLAFSADDSSRTRAVLKVQDGCNYHCSYCTIPLARGTGRSLPVDRCLRLAEEITARGFKEIVLTGVNVGDYDGEGGLLGLLRAMTRVPGLRRVRVSSIEPNVLTDDIIGLVADEPVLCAHFHLPLQSGSDRVLRWMRRRYTTAHYAALVTKLRHRLPACGIGADVIAGFPGETDALFEETYRFLRDLPISYLHAFTYSERPNTLASAMPGQVEPRVRFLRSRRLRALGEMKRLSFARQLVGTEVTVLTEGDRGDSTRSGFTESYVRVSVASAQAGGNELLRVRVTDAQPDVCRGEVVAVEGS